MSAPSAIEAPAHERPSAGAPRQTGSARRPSRLRLVAGGASGAPGRRRADGPGQPVPSSCSIDRRVVSGAAVRGIVVGSDPLRSRPPQRRSAATRAPVRLTRRGRIVLGGLTLACLTVAVLLITLLASGGAQATNHGQVGAGLQGMHQVVVQPGQTLWSIAAAAEPTADTRMVVQEIMTANALDSADISAGQLLWVPR